MNKLRRNDLWTLEAYSRERAKFREKVIAHKQNRQVVLGDHARLLFEDRTTVHYQIQEMLRVERIFEDAGIQDELDAYNPLIPDGHNWKATFLLEYTDPVERQRRVRELLGIEHEIWLEVAGHQKVFAIADEDMDRADEEKTSTVHFLRFELTPSMIQAVKGGADFRFGISHAGLPVDSGELPDTVRRALADDLITTH